MEFILFIGFGAIVAVLYAGFQGIVTQLGKIHRAITEAKGVK
jgi:hypothetical protein